MSTSQPAQAGEPDRDIQRLRLALALARHEYADLLAAARAAVAAAARGDPNPLFWIRDQLSSHDQLPAPGAIPAQVAATTRAVLAA